MIVHEYDLEKSQDGRVEMVVRRTFELGDEYQIDTPKDVVDFFEENYDISRKIEEHMYMLPLNQAGKLVGCFMLSRGTAEQSYVNVRGLFQRALLCNATRFILVHNHPAGNLIPSRVDIDATNRLKDLGNMMEVQILDHIIVAGEGQYVSFKEQELL